MTETMRQTANKIFLPIILLLLVSCSASDTQHDTSSASIAIEHVTIIDAKNGLQEDMTLEVVEPLRDLYKDEVRDLARELKIRVADRQPFPGPGLAVRCLGPLTKERVHVVREACAIVEEELELAASEGKMEIPWQYFAALLPVRSVGVHGDVRAYGETVVVRAVQSMDGMSARYSTIPHDILAKISTRITNTVKGAVNRVVYDITHKPPGTIEWE